MPRTTSSSASGRPTSGVCTTSVSARVGTAICHDSDFFESWRILALRGAEVILLPHANRTMPAGGGELTFDGRERLAAGRGDPGSRRRSCSRSGPPAAAPRRPGPRQRRLRGLLRHGRVRRAQHARRRRVRDRARRVDVRAEWSPLVETGGLESTSTRSSLERARENPWFALKKRRPEAYGELTAPL